MASGLVEELGKAISSSHLVPRHGRYLKLRFVRKVYSFTANQSGIISFSVSVILTLAWVQVQSDNGFAPRRNAATSIGPNKEFSLLQRKYFIPYFMALFSDWLQGPYVYKLYSYYGYAQDEIAVLYITGFAASVTFGTATGPLADKFGRKKLSITFCLMYTLCCLSKLSPSYDILLAGRVLGGISTSILFSVFESWYIHEHTVVWKYPLEWISITFSKATFFNGLLAIIAGVIAEVGADWLDLGPVAPFLTAIPFLVIASVWIYLTWDENLGQQERNWGGQCLEGLTTILGNRKILFLGLIQSIFESCMYIFVFLWTPVLEGGKPPLGLTFSSFMVAIMIGSSLYSHLLTRGFKSERILTVCLAIMSSCMFFCGFLSGPTWPNSEIFIYTSFLFLETAVGLYFPSIGYVRGEVIPDGLRANIMNWFRVPMNIITCGGLIGMHKLNTLYANQIMFLLCGALSILGLMISLVFSRMMKRSPIESTKEDLLT
ncbi:unnamed protein product [Allacma fusca]|uniref:Molybdate transporter 2 homolog n=1 Tax=Allacma fusca TaxID=39272 RepID=A0A8J2J3P8_9HEXA|nr:unnamed protein product [Allacma fusca]